MLDNLQDYRKLTESIGEIKDAEEKRQILRRLCRTDLYFLLWFACGRKDVEHPWLLARCKEVQQSPDGYLDLWSREHFKSSIVTFAKTVQDILINPNVTIGIFSHTRPIAKGFLRQIKRELEANQILLWLFPDILWVNPKKDAPKWSEDDGLIVRRTKNPKESTVEAWGLVDGQPTSKHFDVLVYDDMVTIDNARSPEMINKTVEAWGISTNLGSKGGKQRYVGTRYHFNDAYKTIMDRGAAIPRIYPCTEDGTLSGEPVLLSREEIEKKRREQGEFNFSCQMLLNPVADESQGFKNNWIKTHKPDAYNLNTYIVVDPASEKKKSNDYSFFGVIGLGQDENYYILDMIRDRLSLTQRADALFSLHKKWKPLRVGYEKYGQQADIQHIEDRQQRENYRFEIVPLGGQMPKNDRIRRLIPLFEQGRIYLPDSCWKTNYEGRLEDLTTVFIEQEYKAFPVGVHDDMLDGLARILDEAMQTSFPSSGSYASGRLNVRTGIM